METSVDELIGSTFKSGEKLSLTPGACTSCSTGHGCSSSTSCCAL